MTSDILRGVVINMITIVIVLVILGLIILFGYNYISSFFTPSNLLNKVIQ